MQADILQSTAFTWAFKLYLTDHITPATGKTVAITISKNTAGLAAFGNPSAGASVATEVGSGWYYFVSSTTDTNTLGPMIWLGTATGCDNADQAYQVIKATNGGMTALPDTAVTTNASLITSGTSTAQLSVSSGAVLLQPTQSGVTIPTVTTVTNQLTAAQVATGVWQDATAGDFTTSSSIGKSLYTTGNAPGAASGLALVGSNMGTVSSVSGSVGSVTGLTTATIATAIWTDTTAGDFTTLTSPGKIIFTQLGGAFTTTSSSIFTTAALANGPTGGTAPTVGQIATAVWQDTTAGDFTTAGSIGKSLFTSGNAPGAASGLALVGSNMGTVTSVSGAVGSVASGVTLTSAGLDAVVVEIGLNARQGLSIACAALAGVSSGVNAGSPVYLGAGVATTRITATASSGDRSVVTLNPPP